MIVEGQRYKTAFNKIFIYKLTIADADSMFPFFAATTFCTLSILHERKEQHKL